MGCGSSVAVCNTVPHDGGEGHAKAGARALQNKGSAQKDAKKLVERAFKKYRKGPRSLMMSKFPEYNAEEVLNDLQCLLQVQHHMAVLYEKEGDLVLEHDLMKIHECEYPSVSERKSKRARARERVLALRMRYALRMWYASVR